MNIIDMLEDPISKIIIINPHINEGIKISQPTFLHLFGKSFKFFILYFFTLPNVKNILHLDKYFLHKSYN